MRFKSKVHDGYTVYAVSGTNIVSFGIDFSGADTKGLLGFAVERHDLTEQERYFMKGFKVFKDVMPNPADDLQVSTFDNPVQSFVWDDFTAKPGYEYDYYFYPLKGSPKFLDRLSPVVIKVKTEELYTEGEHDVFFNRGVASSQEYARRFNNQKPSEIADPALKQEAYNWLSRDLKDAFYKFIDRARKGDTLFGCFYEFHYQEAVDKFQAAIDRGVNVQLVIDCKDNGDTDAKGVDHESFPKQANLKALKKAGIAKARYTQRLANTSAICHNKFLLWQPKGAAQPQEVWTGSTNISEGGIFGQTNVGHWVKNEATAVVYKQYWDLLNSDAGGHDGTTTARQDNAAYKKAVVALTPDRSPADISASAETVMPVFSPRPGKKMLDTYFELIDNTTSAGFITLAFGISKDLKDKLVDNTFKNSIVFMLLEKKDGPNARSKDKDAFVRLNAKNNVYQAYGSYIPDKLYEWTWETNTRKMGMNAHVLYIHTKFLLQDPLGSSPVVVTGSANFSSNSTTANDENMIIIKGDTRVADIYFTEFNRLFNHYYFRSILQDLKTVGHTPDEDSLFLLPDDSWLGKYKTGKLRMKRLGLYTGMSGAVTL